MDKEIILKSGNKLSFQYAEFETEQDLYSVITKELEDKNINVKDGSEGLTVSIVKALGSIMGSKAVTEQFWKCANTCLYNGERITPAIFQNIEARKDFMEIKYHILFNNVAVFFSNLLSKLKDLEIQESEGLKTIMQSLMSK